MVRRKCKAKNCPVTSDTHPNQSLHRFPINPRRFRIWCELAEHGNDGIQYTFYLCNRHFPQSAFFDKERLRKRPSMDPIYRTSELNPITNDYSPLESYIPQSPPSPTPPSPSSPSPPSPSPSPPTPTPPLYTPTPSTNKTQLVTGINPHVFDKLKQRMAGFRDKRFSYCVLMWDEIPLKQHVEFSSPEDVIYGFEDLGNGKRSRKLAQNALVFSLVGIFHKWEQPVAFYFSSGSTDSTSLVNIVKSILRHCFLAGVTVKVTICEAHPVNREVYQQLQSYTDIPFFRYGTSTVYTMFDPPHLLKSIRNLLRTHRLEFQMNLEMTPDGQPKTGVASWDHIEKAVEFDKMWAAGLKYMPKITPDHLHPTGAAKMDVRLAAQVLSRSVAVGIATAVRMNASGFDSHALATAEVCAFFDQLFDSFNGFTKDPQGASGFRTAISKDNHPKFSEFWNSAIKKLRSMKFFHHSADQSRPETISATPTINGWIRTIKAASLLWESLREELPHMTYLEMRRLNQDHLESLFESIRFKCGGNFSPSCLQFVSAFKTCLQNGITSSGVRGSREEPPWDAELLVDLQTFLSGRQTPVSPIRAPTFFPEIRDELGQRNLSTVHVAGSAIKKFLDESMCNHCLGGLISKDRHEFAPLISMSLEQYSEQNPKLLYPSSDLAMMWLLGITKCKDFFDEDVFSPNILRRLSQELIKSLGFSWWRRGNNCKRHSTAVLNAMILSMCSVYIPWWCMQKNRSLEDDHCYTRLERKRK